MRLIPPAAMLLLVIYVGEAGAAAPLPGITSAKATPRLLKPFRAIGQRFKERRAFNRDVRQARRSSTEVNKAYKATLKTGLKWTSPVLAIGGAGAVGGGVVATHCATLLGNATPLQVLLAGPALIGTGYLATAVAVPSAIGVGATVATVRRQARLDAFGAALGQSQVSSTLSSDGMRHYRRFLVKEQRISSRRLDRLTGKARPNQAKIADERATLQDLTRQLGQIDSALPH